MENENKGEIIIYQSDDGGIRLDVKLEDETVWLTQEQLCLLFGKAKATISEHISHIFSEGELDPKVVVRFFRTTTQHGAMEGKRKHVRWHFTTSMSSSQWAIARSPSSALVSANGLRKGFTNTS